MFAPKKSAPFASVAPSAWCEALSYFSRPGVAKNKVSAKFMKSVFSDTKMLWHSDLQADTENATLWVFSIRYEDQSLIIFSRSRRAMRRTSFFDP